MMNTTEWLPGEVRKAEKAVAGYQAAFRQLVDHVPVDQLSALVTDKLDAVLCDAWGNTGATRYWRRHLLERCGTEAVRGVGARSEGERMPRDRCGKSS